jgi:hypothetical protein
MLPGAQRVLGRGPRRLPGTQAAARGASRGAWRGRLDPAAEQAAAGECGAAGMPYVDVGELGFEAAMREARRLLLGRG